MSQRRIDEPRAVAALTDDLGVLSAYRTVDPGAADVTRVTVEQQLTDPANQRQAAAVQNRVRDLKPFLTASSAWRCPAADAPCSRR